MRQLIHNISVRVFEKNEDQIDNIYHVFKQLLPVDFEEEKINLDHQKAEGFEEETIHILSMETTKRRNNWLLLRNIFENLKEEDKHKLYEQRKTRVDKQGYFYIRLDKNSLLNQEYKVTEKGDCFHFKIKIAAFPKKRETIMDSVETILEKTGCN